MQTLEQRAANKQSILLKNAGLTFTADAAESQIDGYTMLLLDPRTDCTSWANAAKRLYETAHTTRTAIDRLEQDPNIEKESSIAYKTLRRVVDSHVKTLTTLCQSPRVSQDIGYRAACDAHDIANIVKDNNTNIPKLLAKELEGLEECGTSYFERMRDAPVPYTPTVNDKTVRQEVANLKKTIKETGTIYQTIEERSPQGLQEWERHWEEITREVRNLGPYLRRIKDVSLGINGVLDEVSVQLTETVHYVHETGTTCKDVLEPVAKCLGFVRGGFREFYHGRRHEMPSNVSDFTDAAPRAIAALKSRYKNDEL